MGEKKNLRKPRKQYTFEEDTAIVARTVINIVDTSTIDSLLLCWRDTLRGSGLSMLYQKHPMDQSASEKQMGKFSPFDLDKHENSAGREITSANNHACHILN